MRMAGKPPTTMDELVKLAADIKAAGIIPFAHANAEWRPADEWFVTSFLNNIAGPDKVYQALKGDLDWDNPDFENALDILNKFQADGDFMGGLDRYYTATFNESHTALGDGSAAMNIEGSWFLASVSTFFGDAAGNTNDWDWVPVPSTTGDAIYPLGIGSTWSINAATEHPDESGEFLNYLFSGDTQAKILTSCGVAPAPVKLDPAALTSLDPRDARLRTALNDAAAKNNYGYTTWTFWPPKSDTYIYEQIEKVWAGSLTTKDYLAGLQHAVRPGTEGRHGSAAALSLKIDLPLTQPLSHARRESQHVGERSRFLGRRDRNTYKERGEASLWLMLP